MKYRKPRSFNWVTFMLLAVAGLVVYLLVYLWPVYSLRSRARGILLDQVPMFYKANLLPENVAQPMMDKVRANIRTELAKLGVNDKAAKIYLRRGQKEIELEVQFKARAHFPWPDKTYEFNLSPKVVTDATRVDW